MHWHSTPSLFLHLGWERNALQHSPYEDDALVPAKKKNLNTSLTLIGAGSFQMIWTSVHWTQELELSIAEVSQKQILKQLNYSLIILK